MKKSIAQKLGISKIVVQARLTAYDSLYTGQFINSMLPSGSGYKSSGSVDKSVTKFTFLVDKNYKNTMGCVTDFIDETCREGVIPQIQAVTEERPKIQFIADEIYCLTINFNINFTGDVPDDAKKGKSLTVSKHLSKEYINVIRLHNTKL